ncbi:MAG: hypothetical protein Q7S61_05755 [bacterium]|nr:hypothetical protein [bacterium]
MKKIVQISIVIFFLAFVTHARAQELDFATITVVPAVQEIQVTPGEKTRAQIQFRNSGQSLEIGVVKVADFTVTDKKGTTELVEDVPLKPKYSASSWITLDQNELAVPAHEFGLVTMTINPPKDLTSCGYYAVVYFQPDEGKIKRLGQNQSATSVTRKIGGLINFITEGKECKEDLSIVRFETPKFMEYGPITTSFDVANNGDIHIAPLGSVILSNTFGDFVDQKTLAEIKIFPERARTYDVTLGHTWMVGRYKMELAAAYGSKNAPLQQSAYVWVFPWRVAIVALLSLSLLIILLTKIYTQFIKKEVKLEQELHEEQAEIEKLKEELKKRHE